MEVTSHKIGLVSTSDGILARHRCIKLVESLSLDPRAITTALDQLADAVFAVTASGEICLWNRGAENMFGYSLSDVSQKICFELFCGRRSLVVPVCGAGCSVRSRSLAEGYVPGFNMEVTTQSRQRIWINVTTLVLREPCTRRQLVLHLARKIDQTRALEILTSQMVAIAKQVVTLSTLSEPEHLPPPAVLLTKQELKLLCALGSGMAPEALAFKFRITPHTLRNHIHHINEKLGTHSRLEAVVEAMRRGLI